MEYVFIVILLALIMRWCFGGMAAAIFVFISAVVLCSHNARAEPLRFEVSIVLDDAADKPAAEEAMQHAASIFRNQLSIELVTVYSEVAYVADHTNGDALLIALQSFRDKQPKHRASDATVLLTRRELTRMYQGIASVGPACSPAAAAVVSLKADGLDGQIVAHELLHTVGVPHDSAPGWLMSESLARNGIETASPDTISTVKAAPLDCMLAIEPRTASPSSGVEPHTQAQGQGGGGAFEGWFIIALLALIVIAAQESRIRKVKHENAELDHEIRDSLKELHTHVPPDFCIRDIKWLTMSERILRIEFTTLSGSIDFETWLRSQIRRARREHAQRTESGS